MKSSCQNRPQTALWRTWQQAVDDAAELGVDATNKWPGETQREWGRPLVMDPAVAARVDGIFQSLGL